MIAYSITSCQTNDNLENNDTTMSETEVLLSELKKTYFIDYQIVDSIPTSARVLSIEELKNVETEQRLREASNYGFYS